MLWFLLQCFYFILPGAVGNSFPPIMKNKWKMLGVPVCEKYFGSHKTWRGVIVTILGSVFVTWVQYIMFFDYPSMQSVYLVDFTKVNFLAFGLLAGIGVVAGDIVESFIKRKLGRKPGTKFWPWDQIDSLIGALVFIMPVFVPSWQTVLCLIAMTLALHFMVKRIGYAIGVNDSKW